MPIERMRACVLVLTICLVLAVTALSRPGEATAADGKIVVANRNSGTISVIDVSRDAVIGTFALPMLSGDAVPEPMYVVNTPAKNHVWVGDRANDRVVVFDGNKFHVEAIVPVGDGVFHMATDRAGHQLWVVNDTAKTATVVDARRLEVVATVPMPGDLGLPHDVVLDDQGLFAYVTFLADGTVVQFETLTYTEVGRALVGASPHVAYNGKRDELYLPCQGSSAVFVLDAVDLTLVDILLGIPNAHGAIMSTNSQEFYTTNIAAGGFDAILRIDTKSNAVTGVADTPNPVPHNLALTANGKKLYVTHSGPGTTVSVFATDKKGNPTLLKSIPVGDNPFGLAHVR